MKLALNGPLLSGKTELARQLERRGFSFVDFTGHIKVLAAIALSSIGLQVERRDIEANKEQYRPFLIALATLAGIDDGNYVRMLVDDERNDIVFDNVRTPEQWAILKEMGFVLVKLAVPYDVLVDRARARGLNAQQLAKKLADPSEHWMDGITPDIILRSDESLMREADNLLATAAIYDATRQTAA